MGPGTRKSKGGGEANRITFILSFLLIFLALLGNDKSARRQRHSPFSKLFKKLKIKKHKWLQGRYGQSKGITLYVGCALGREEIIKVKVKSELSPNRTGGWKGMAGWQPMGHRGEIRQRLQQLMRKVPGKTKPGEFTKLASLHDLLHIYIHTM